LNTCNRMTRRLVLAGLLVIASPGVMGAQPSPLWGKLTPGPHAVGYTSSWQFDYSRRHNTTFADKSTYATGKSPRPILVNLWYPARKAGGAESMPHRRYLNIRSHEPLLAKFSAELAKYNHGVIAREVIGKPPAELTAREKALLEQLLDTPTACEWNATPAPGRFPLVIYHAGAGSSFEDNSVLCEFLASHGFVVLGSAFQQQSGDSFNTDNREGSMRDLDFLIAHARQLPSADWNRIGLIGHSAGAQAALRYRSQPDTTVDAVVSLDTTQDYRGVEDPLWQFTAQVMANGKNFNCPLLMVAGPSAFFALADSLQAAERYYLTMRDMDHNDYISQGVISRERLYHLRFGGADQTAEGRAKEKTALDRACGGYEALCLYILRFLEAELKGDTTSKEFLARQYRDTIVGGAEPHVEYVPSGRTGPDLYQMDSPLPPTPRQVRPFLGEHGSRKTIEVLRRFRKQAAAHPIYSSTFELHLVSDLLDQGRTEDAIAFHDYYRESGLDCVKEFLTTGKWFQSMGRKQWAADYYRRVLLLEPSNKEAATSLKEVSEEK
jgi:dienelactone hydrolase